MNIAPRAGASARAADPGADLGGGGRAVHRTLVVDVPVTMQLKFQPFFSLVILKCPRFTSSTDSELPVASQRRVSTVRNCAENWIFRSCSSSVRLSTRPLLCNDWCDGPDTAENCLEARWSTFM